MDLIRFFCRWVWVLVIMTLLGVAGGYGFLQFGPLRYQSTALLTVRPQADSNGEALVSTNPARLSGSAVALAGQAASPSVFDATSRALVGQLDISSEEIRLLVLNGRILVSPVGTTSFISVGASDPDPQRAWLVADGFTRGFMEDLGTQTRVVMAQRQMELQLQIEILQKQLAAAPSSYNNANLSDMFNVQQSRVYDALTQAQARLQLLARPEPPVSRYGETSAPVLMVSEPRVLIGGAAVGGALGFVLAYLMELVRQWQKQRRPRQPVLRPSTGPPPEGLPRLAVSSATVNGSQSAPSC